MNSAYGAPKTIPIGWRPNATRASRGALDGRALGRGSPSSGGAFGWGDVRLVMTCWLILVAAAASAESGLCWPKMTDFDQSSRKACQASIEFGTLGTSIMCAASAANSL